MAEIAVAAGVPPGSITADLRVWRAGRELNLAIR